MSQGTYFGSLCFFIYINYLSVNIKYSILKFFADDAKIYFYFPLDNWPDLLQIYLNNITQWAFLWQLTTSVEKTCILYVNNGNTKNVYDLSNVNLNIIALVKELAGCHCYK